VKVPDKPTITNLIDEAREAALSFKDMAACYKSGTLPSAELFERLIRAHDAVERWWMETEGGCDYPSMSPSPARPGSVVPMKRGKP
jgi:hypothetical protein